MKKHVIFLFIILYSLFSPQIIFAEYVLPYPSYMPGNKLYTVSKIMERLESCWYWGAIGQTKYHMKLADKYLVEAKTLFEYKQYMLATRALQFSDEHVALIPKYIGVGKEQDKNMSEFELRFAEQMDVHRAVLGKLKNDLPKTFIWTPEKEPPTTLNIEELVLRAITLRM